jgi:hypothetical protein
MEAPWACPAKAASSYHLALDRDPRIRTKRPCATANESTHFFTAPGNERGLSLPM